MAAKTVIFNNSNQTIIIVLFNKKLARNLSSNQDNSLNSQVLIILLVVRYKVHVIIMLEQDSQIFYRSAQASLISIMFCQPKSLAHWTTTIIIYHNTIEIKSPQALVELIVVIVVVVTVVITASSHTDPQEMKA
jgi:hypothetical protein